MVCNYDGFELVEERWISYSVLQEIFLVTDALKRVAKVVEGRGGEGRGGEVGSPDPVSRTN